MDNRRIDCVEKFMSAFQKSKVVDWLAQGDSVRALKYMTKHELLGSIDACIGLANYYFSLGEREKSDDYIDRAERALQESDIDGRISLISAYNTALGRGNREHQQKRALYHLEMVGEAGNNYVEIELMNHYLYGLNGAPKDFKKFMYWANRAIDNGSKYSNEIRKLIEKESKTSRKRRSQI